MEIALKVEEKLRVGPTTKKGGGSFGLYSGKGGISGQTSQYNPKPFTNFTQQNTTSSSLPQNTANQFSSINGQRHGSLPVARPVGEIRRLSEKELQSKREKGLCFRCDEKWSTSHRCRRRELSVLLA